MMRSDECTDRRLQLCDAAMGAAAQLFVRKSGEPPLAEVQPGHRGLVRAAVVHDPMHVEVTRHGGIDWIQELPKRRRPMSLMKRGDQLAGLHVGRGEQGGVPCRRQSVRAPLPLAGAHRHELRTPGTGAPARNPAAARGGMGVRRWASGEQRHPAPRETWPPSGEPPRLLAPPRFRAPRGGVLRRVSSQTATSPPRPRISERHWDQRSRSAAPSAARERREPRLAGRQHGRRLERVVGPRPHRGACGTRAGAGSASTKARMSALTGAGASQPDR